MAITSKKLIKALKKIGFVVQKGRGKGSHIVLKKDNTVITVPQSKGELKQGTLKSILKKLKEVGISRDDILRKDQKG